MLRGGVNNTRNTTSFFPPQRFKKTKHQTKSLIFPFSSDVSANIAQGFFILENVTVLPSFVTENNRELAADAISKPKHGKIAKIYIQ